MEIEYYQRKGNIKKKIQQKAFQNIVAIFKVTSILVFFFVLICRICSRSLLILCAIIVVFSKRTFQNLDLGIEGFKV